MFFCKKLLQTSSFLCYNIVVVIYSPSHVPCARKEGSVLKDFGYIEENLRRVSAAIANAAHAANRPLPRMVAVTKSASPEEVVALVDLGVSEIAENRTVLFRERWALFSDEKRPVMHLIGSLQTNKVKEVVGDAALIQSVDRRGLALEIQKRAQKAGIRQGA